MKPVNLILIVLAGFTVSCSEPPKPVEPAPTQPESVSTTPTEKQVFFGDLHLHTALSVDAYITNTRTMPDDAYRYAKGEAIEHVSGEMIQLQTPLDFMGVTDHAEMLGVARAMSNAEDPLSDSDFAQDITSSEYERSHGAFRRLVSAAADGDVLDVVRMINPIHARRAMRDTWEVIVEAAEAHNDPGKFTTFVAYEWTSMPQLSNLHRNVVFEGTNVPDMPFSSSDSNDPEDLWEFMDEWREEGSDVLAIPHNSNASKGLMYPLEGLDGDPVDEEYAAARLRNEPITEITQFKGTSETHPILAPLDEFADFEIWNTTVGAPVVIDPVPGSYVRNAYQRGLSLEEEIGINPYEFGLIGSSDSHNSSTAVEEFNFTGGHGNADDTPKTRLNSRESTLTASSLNFSASGLAAVWAEENTRESLFAAMKRRETYATSGTRIRLKFSTSDGVPMGGRATVGEALPSFDIWAQQDANSAPLDRVQVIKVTSSGESIVDVACSVGEPDPETQRCPSNGAGVNLETCEQTGEGAAELKVSWQDEAFDSAQRTAYYVRVLENPTCRWSTWDAIRIGQAIPENRAATIQERAWSSPIWVN